MTEAEWLECVKPHLLMRFYRRTEGVAGDFSSWLGSPAYGRLPVKWRRFLMECCRRVAPLLGVRRERERVLRMMDLIEQFVETPPPMEVGDLLDRGFPRWRGSTQLGHFGWGLTTSLGVAAGSLRVVAGRAARKRAVGAQKPAAERAALDAEAVAQCDLIRCLFGNPFRPVAVDPAWLTSTVVGLAEGIYADHSFDRLPILADALQDAGCEDENILAHCRGDGPHARGCWVIDLVLGKS